MLIPCIHAFLQIFEDGCIEMMYLRDIEEYLVHICIWNHLEKGKGEGRKGRREREREGEKDEGESHTVKSIFHRKHTPLLCSLNSVTAL